MARPEKIAAVDKIAEKIERAQSLFITDFSGLDVESINELRRLLRENAVEYRVVKNTLARLAVVKAGREDLKPYLLGPTAMAFGFEDPILPAKLLSQFAKKTGKPSVKAILFENQILGQEAMDRLKTLLSREELLIKTMGALKAPSAQLVLVLGGLLRKLLSILEAISQAKSRGEGREVEESAEAKVKDKAEAETEAEVAMQAKAKQKAEQKLQVGTEEKADQEAQEKVEKKAEEKKEVEQKPIGETESKLTEEESSAAEPEGYGAKRDDSLEHEEGQSVEVRPESEKKRDH